MEILDYFGKTSGKIDSYYIGYHTMIQSLEGPDVEEGLAKSLYLIKLYTDSDNVILHKKNEDGVYFVYMNHSHATTTDSFLTTVLNRTNRPIEGKKYVDVTGTDGRIKYMFIPIKSKESDYIVSIAKPKLDILNVDPNLVDVISHSFSVIIDKLEYQEKMHRSAYEDDLTGLYNRNMYIEKMKEIDRTQDHYVFAIFDLFRIKYINDNFNHKIGDDYIIKSAEILKKYFPKYSLVNSSYNPQFNYGYSVESNDSDKLYVPRNHNLIRGTKKVKTGHDIFRIGGDEFVVITNADSREVVELKAQVAAEEVKKLDLGIGENLPIGLNYGVSSRENMETAEELYTGADALLSVNKREMYKSLGIDRRK